jgi:hypothetical protein
MLWPHWRPMRTAIVVLTAILLWSAPALAGDFDPATVTARAVLASASAATGAFAPGKYVMIVHAKGGGVEETRTSHIDGDDYIETTQSGPFTAATGEAGGRRWKQNTNGIVRMVSGFHTKSNPNEKAWDALDDPKSHMKMLGTTKTTPREYAIEVHPDNGVMERRYYNCDSYTLDRDEFLAKDYHSAIVYSDYRTAFGKRLAFARHFDGGNSGNAQDTTIVSIERDGADVPFAVPSSRPLFELPEAAVKLPARFTQDGIVIRATIGGRGLDFALDSGASGLTIDPGVAHQLGLTTHGKATDAAFGGDVDVSRTIVPSMQLGPVDIHNAAFDVVPFGDDGVDTRLVGLLGYDVFASAIVGVDFKHQTVALYSREAFLQAEQGLFPVPIQLDDGIPRAPVTIEGIKGGFLVDTGSFASLAFDSFISKLPNVTPAFGEHVPHISGVGGDVAFGAARVKNMNFGPLTFQEVDFVVPISYVPLEDYDGILGRNALQRYVLFFDYADKVIYVGAGN